MNVELNERSCLMRTSWRLNGDCFDNDVQSFEFFLDRRMTFERL